MPAPAWATREVTGCHRTPSAEARTTGSVDLPSDVLPTAIQPAGPCVTEASPAEPVTALRLAADSSVQLPFEARRQIAG